MNAKRVFLAGLLLVAAAAVAAEAPKHACCAAAACATAEAAPLTQKSLYQLEGRWTNDADQPVALSSLRGRPVVLAMFFASCEYACPVIVSDMNRLRDLLPAEVRDTAQFVLVSFDSDRDTPAALKTYRDKTGLGASWTLLHGGAADVQELAMLLGVKFSRDANGQFSHSNLITVLNEQGEIAFQKNGLMGDVSEAAKAVTLAAR